MEAGDHEGTFRLLAGMRHKIVLYRSLVRKRGKRFLPWKWCGLQGRRSVIRSIPIYQSIRLLSGSSRTALQALLTWYDAAYGLFLPVHALAEILQEWEVSKSSSLRVKGSRCTTPLCNSDLFPTCTPEKLLLPSAY